MTFEEAVKTAIEYEEKVRDAYLNNLDDIKDPAGRRVFEMLGREEQGHIDFLETKLEEWKENGKLAPSVLKTVVPARKKIEEGVKRLEFHKAKNDFSTELEMVKKALVLEQETSDFYRKMANELGKEGHLFAQFLEIEDGHTAIVQAELDYLTKSGNFFDFQEFTMEY
ncbi:MAG: ferritin family protein [Candidatus Zixiibacteriota bacterium]